MDIERWIRLNKKHGVSINKKGSWFEIIKDGVRITPWPAPKSLFEVEQFLSEL